MGFGLGWLAGRLRPAYRVLFVCTANVCRSPMAEALFLHHLAARGAAHRVRVASAGLEAGGRRQRPDARAVRVLAMRGVPMRRRAGRGLDSVALDRFDRVLCMNGAQVRAVIARGGRPDRVVSITRYLDDPAVDEIPDPYHGPLAGFEHVAALLDAACGRLAEELLSGDAGEGAS